MRRVFNLPLTVVAMAEASDEVNRLRRDIRDSLGIDTVEVRQSLDTALQIRKRLADNRIVALLMDRHLGRDRVQVNFLGRPTWFLRTPALMAFLSGAPLVPCFIERIDGGRFSVSPGEPIFVATDVPARRGDPASGAAVRRPARGADSSAPRLLVSLLSLLGRAARLLRSAGVIARVLMDPVSHVIFGRTIVAALEKRRPARDSDAAPELPRCSAPCRPTSTAVLMPAGWDIYLRFHEIGTHSLAGSILVGCAVGGPDSLVRARFPDWRALAAAGSLGAVEPSGARRVVRSSTRACCGRFARRAESPGRWSRWPSRG